jgi:succinoglycan biosynthesis transport protein ExoP
MRADYGRSEDAGASGDINLSDIIGALSRNRWWVIAPTLIAFVGALVFVNVVKPRYTAEARVLLENQENYFTRVDKGERADSLAPDAEAVQSQIQLVTSRDLARRVIKTLNLQGNPEFDPLAEGVSPLTRLLVLLGVSRDPTRLSPEDRILESYFDRIAVYSPTKTRVLVIEFTSRDPDLAARAANAIADAYIDMQQEQADFRSSDARRPGGIAGGGLPIQDGAPRRQQQRDDRHAATWRPQQRAVDLPRRPGGCAGQSETFARDVASKTRRRNS